MKKIGIVCMLVGSVLLAGCGTQPASNKNVEQSTSELTTEAMMESTNQEMEEDASGVTTDRQLQNVETEQETEKSLVEERIAQMTITVGESSFVADLESNEAVEELVAMMKEAPVTISMSDYSGFEKVGSLGRSLTTNNSQTTTKSGDIVLYNGNQIVIFYGSNSWSYTRLGNVSDLSGWEKALGSGDVTVTFSIP